MNRVFMIGINGSGMSKLALILKDMGYSVSGFDVKESETAEELRKYGIAVHTDNNFSLDNNFDLVVVSSAIREEDPILKKAKSLGLPVQKRGELLASISRRFKSIVVSGTHGKTTTTSMIGHILSNLSTANVYFGGKSNERIDFSIDKEFFVIESDESDKTFLLFNPKILVITNIDRDHLTSYNNDFEQLKNSFKDIAERSSIKVVSMDDENAFAMTKNLKDTYFYSLRNKEAHAYSENISYLENGVEFDLYLMGNYLLKVNLPVFGDKSILNSLSSILVTNLLGFPIGEIIRTLQSYRMPERRLETKGEVSGITLIDDHADHPTEVFATLSALRSHFPARRIISIFEPHRFTRINALKEEIAVPFSLADVVISTEIYPAFEEAIEGINGEKVHDWIKAYNPKKSVYYISNKDDIPAFVADIAKPGDIIVLLGPGEIGSISSAILSKLRRKFNEECR